MIDRVQLQQPSCWPSIGGKERGHRIEWMNEWMDKVTAGRMDELMEEARKRVTERERSSSDAGEGSNRSCAGCSLGSVWSV